ncbi:MAG TPA: hypothetical protein DEG17_04300 [Cyanobacteria bacterium UBA11149]|nr:hypothetical protein [Cyanobacteria bacterium UBA11367]HBE56132.1 hypothetical protein [Cyanobacteria bacterium UBA11366]HBK65217.1 hypothetical protein [Cyanobacteria bacterium UBA11166]HBR76904.1 hypothetical protein [Cyanobacteria bacterium UBA11159]HBS69248.1 hypothetical protein [Cyanobacteria bacterium UBA11153]HBW88111.1 hypothetical protein [Cyanobacteria bacterium UBA11149]HCA96852.1 hypothetical protein [Cyanobacteria bacterium UBA9226]
MNDERDLGARFGDIGQIRDILFGAQIKEYTNRLESVESSLKELRDLTDDRIKALQEDNIRRLEDLKQILTSGFQSAIEAMGDEIKSMNLKDNEEKNEIRQNIDRLSKRLSSNVATLDEAIDKQTRSLRDDLLSSHKKLQSDLLDLRDRIFEELDKRVDLLATDKIARKDMAEMFFELFLKLKGSELVPPLQQGGESQGTNYLLPEEAQSRE